MVELAPHIHAASFVDRVVILDLRANRYRLLNGRKARALHEILAGNDAADKPALLALRKEGILSWSRQAPTPGTPFCQPGRGALEHADPGSLSFSNFEVARNAAAAAFLLRLTSLTGVLAWARAEVCRVTATTDGQLVGLAHAFERSRMHVPLRRSCLRDAVLLSRLLLRRRIACQLVFGVRLDPFGAHSWVQAGDLVLTGSLALARGLTPILVR